MVRAIEHLKNRDGGGSVVTFVRSQARGLTLNTGCKDEPQSLGNLAEETLPHASQQPRARRGRLLAVGEGVRVGGGRVPVEIEEWEVDGWNAVRNVQKMLIESSNWRTSSGPLRTNRLIPRGNRGLEQQLQAVLPVLEKAAT